jgi:hypothetical protein
MNWLCLCDSALATCLTSRASLHAAGLRANDIWCHEGPEHLATMLSDLACPQRYISEVNEDAPLQPHVVRQYLRRATLGLS